MDPAKFAMYLAVVISPSVVSLLAERLSLGEVEAMNKYYSSLVYASLSDEATKVWHYSPELICALVEEELRTGKFTFPEEAM